MRKSIIAFLVVLIIVIIAVGGYFSARYYFSSKYAPEYFFEHPTIAKILGISPLCSSVCMPQGVCGKDGENYCNQCDAFKHGAGFAHDGKCTLADKGALGLEQLKNASYDVSSEGLYFSAGMFAPSDKKFNSKSLQLVNGSLSFGPDHIVLPSQCTEDVTHSVSIARNSDGTPMVAFGDLNNDGIADAVVMLDLVYKEENKKGPYSYCAPSKGESYVDHEPMLVAFINKDGQPVQVDQYMGRSVGTSDYKIENMQNLKIQGGVITLSEKSAQETYKLVSDELVKVGQSFVAPNIPSDWKTYANNDLGIAFQYPAIANLSVNDQEAVQKEEQTEGGGVSVFVDGKNFKSCVQSDVVIPTEIIVNQVPFYQTEEGDAAMGTYHTEIQYATVKDGKCYSINLQYFTHDCSRYLPLEAGNTQQATDYNQCLADNKSATALRDVLSGIVSTFKLTK